MRKFKRHWGFGLIEILVTLGVLSVGILGVTVLHSTVTKQSSENKSRAEALAIAQSRIEDMRNYTGDVDTMAEFNTLFANTTGFANSTTVTGTNATFTRSEQIAASGNMKTITVQVAWTDQENVSQSVSLNTRVGYTSPRSVGDTAMEAAASIVDAPTGRARLGDGELPADVELSDLASNGDGTYLYDEGGDRMLVTEDEEIVLTLQEACQTSDGSCLDFVRINGRIWIDTDSQGSLAPGSVYVIASDAAFCARHYTVDGVTTRVTSTTTSTVTTDSGDYEYFDYTCYIGGGWHGNVGVLLAAGLGNSDKICIGDPLADPLHASAPVIASRRAYRGMLYKPDSTSTVTINDDTTNTDIPVESYMSGSVAMPRYYSQGIADSVVLPPSGGNTHDFVIGSFQQNLTDGQDCIGEEVLTRPDSNVNGELGDLFEGMPTDFVCLNDGYVDNYDEDEYAHLPTCPYDPSDPPSTRHEVSGTLRLDADDTAENDVIAGTVHMETSDGTGNCLTTDAVHDGTYYQYSYECDVYDWGNGWNGYIEAEYDATEMECDPYRITLSSLTTDSPNNNFLTCNTGQFSVIRGTVTATGNRKLSSASLGTSGACTISATGLAFECITNEYTTSTMSFVVTLTPTSGVMCKTAAPHSGVYSFVNVAPSEIILTPRIANNLTNC